MIQYYCLLDYPLYILQGCEGKSIFFHFSVEYKTEPTVTWLADASGFHDNQQKMAYHGWGSRGDIYIIAC